MSHAPNPIRLAPSFPILSAAHYPFLQLIPPPPLSCFLPQTVLLVLLPAPQFPCSHSLPNSLAAYYYIRSTAPYSIPSDYLLHYLSCSLTHFLSCSLSHSHSCSLSPSLSYFLPAFPHLLPILLLQLLHTPFHLLLPAAPLLQLHPTLLAQLLPTPNPSLTPYLTPSVATYPIPCLLLSTPLLQLHSAPYPFGSVLPTPNPSFTPNLTLSAASYPIPSAAPYPTP
jgi:hypothetical protein